MKLKSAAKAAEQVVEHVGENAVEQVKHVPAVAVHKVGRLSRMVPKGMTRSVGRTTLIASKHSPAILFGAGVVGVIGTTVLACRATLKVDEVLEESNKKLAEAKVALDMDVTAYSVKDYNHDVAIVRVRAALKLIKLYSPSILLGAASIAALAGSHNILNKRNAGLTAAYAAVEKSYADYRKRVVAEYGEDKDRELRYAGKEVEVVEPHPDDPTKQQARKAMKYSTEGVSQYAKLLDEHNINWEPIPEHTLIFLKAQQNYFNDRLRAHGHVFLNEVYDALGLERTQAGQVVGWIYDKQGNLEGDNKVDFGIWGDENLEKFHDFIVGRESALLLDFNVDGIVYDKI